jgi:DHA3 family macrolide efflux protein-like MFS transporter
MNTQNWNWKPRFFTIWIGQAFSLLGSSLVGFALIWWLTTTTGSATVLATAALAGMLPMIVLGPIGGVVADRYNRRIVMVVADSVTAVVTFLLFSLFAAGAAQAWHVYVAMFVRSAAGAFHFPAMQASTTLMVPDQHLARVAGMNQTLNGLQSIAAPPLGALLISLFPITQILLIDVVTAAMAVLPLLFLAIPQPVKQTSHSDQAQPSSFGNDFREGLRYVLSWRALTIMLGMAMVINFLFTPAMTLTPILVTKHYGGAAPQMAMAEAAWGIGLIAGGLFLSVWGGFKRKMLTTIMGLIMMGLVGVVQGVLPPTAFAAAVVMSALSGTTNSLTNGPVFAVMQSAIRPEMQGRVMSLIGAVSGCVAPLGLLVAGPVVDRFGVQIWFLLGGLTCVAMGIASLFIPEVVNLGADRQRSDASAPISVSEAGVNEVKVVDGAVG